MGCMPSKEKGVKAPGGTGDKKESVAEKVGGGQGGSSTQPQSAGAEGTGTKPEGAAEKKEKDTTMAMTPGTNQL